MIIRHALIEHLNSVKTGELVILRADKTSIANANAVNLNSLYKDLMPGDHAKEVFSNVLLRYGYYLRAEYESAEYTFKIKGIQQYVIRIKQSIHCYWMYVHRAFMPVFSPTVPALASGLEKKNGMLQCLQQEQQKTIDFSQKIVQ